MRSVNRRSVYRLILRELVVADRSFGLEASCFSPCPLSQDYRDFAMRFSSSLASVGSGLLGVCQVSAFTFVGCSLSVRLSTVPTV